MLLKELLKSRVTGTNTLLSAADTRYLHSCCLGISLPAWITTVSILVSNNSEENEENMNKEVYCNKINRLEKTEIYLL